MALLTIPATGHVNPTLDLAAELVRRGHQVTYVVPEPYGWAARLTGAGHVAYDSTLVPAPAETPPGPEFAAWLPFVLLEETKHVLPQLVPLMTSLPPDVLVFDRTTYVTARALVDIVGCQSVELFPSFAYNEHFDIAGDLERATILNPGHDAYRQLSDGYAGLAKEWGTTAVTVEEFAVGRADRAVVAIPREFQPAGGTFPASYVFAGPALRTRHAPKPSAQRRGVYAALGTSFTQRADTFRAIARAIETTGRPGLLAVGDLAPDQVPPSTEAVRVVREADQLAELASAEVFVTHAGMGSVQEALALGVPMVCLPQTTEQHAVAARVAELGLGVALGDAPSPAEVGAAIDQVSGDEQVRARVDEWAWLLESLDAGALGADAVQDALAASVAD
ncbi:hypothetical protein VV02_01310 [Luteipulveratus mongoliensis]|uniref:Glycosyl transferase n=1 Tax=Luteipulveratus mongoliensis TaxID=571913 RepID=A0A0K1JE05_9MICO|nr:hypothetical protein VV02_01310 [Luteipulveratus mongoliensis]